MAFYFKKLETLKTLIPIAVIALLTQGAWAQCGFGYDYSVRAKATLLVYKNFVPAEVDSYDARIFGYDQINCYRDPISLHHATYSFKIELNGEPTNIQVLLVSTKSELYGQKRKTFSAHAYIQSVSRNSSSPVITHQGGVPDLEADTYSMYMYEPSELRRDWETIGLIVEIMP